MIKDQILIAAIKPEMIPVMWHTTKPMIEMAIEHSNGELDIDSIYKRLINKDMLLLTISEENKIMACLTVEKREFDSGKNILNITTAGGCDLHFWIKEVNDMIDELAIEHNCSDIYIVGRPAWIRLLKKYGFEKTHTVVSRKVGE